MKNAERHELFKMSFNAYKKNPENCIKLIELIFLFQGWGCFGSFYVDHVVLYQSS